MSLEANVSLDDRIRSAELAVIDRDERFRARLHTLADNTRQSGRKTLRWVGIGVGFVVASVVAYKLLPNRRVSQLVQRSAVVRTRWRASLGLLWSLALGLLRPGSPQRTIAGSAMALLMPLLAARPKRKPAAEAAGAGMQTAASVDLARYCGPWFEYARLPTAYEAHCAGNVVARYEQTGDDGQISIVNRCTSARGKVREVIGVARPVPEARGARLRVSFAPSWLHSLPWVWGDYWILHVDADYRHAVVGTPDRKSLWLLTRTPDVNADVLHTLVRVAQVQGFDIGRLQRTPHGD